MLFALWRDMIFLRDGDIPVASAAFSYGHHFEHRPWATLD